MTTVFLPVDWELAEDHSIAVPRFLGDSEIVNIKMSLTEIELTLNNRGGVTASKSVNASTIKLLFDRPQYLVFKSHHLQNVVDRVYLFTNTELSLARQLPDFTEKSMLAGREGMQFEVLAIVQPVTGGDAIIAAGNKRVFEARHGQWVAN